MGVWYFGRGPRESGHYLHLPNGVVSYNVPEGCTWTMGDLDGGLQPPGPQVQGLVDVHKKGEWRAFAWWDRSGDKRPSSCSVLLFNEPVGMIDAIARGYQTWPWVFERMTFALVPRALAESDDHVLVQYWVLWSFINRMVMSGRLELGGDEAEWFFAGQSKAVWDRLHTLLGCS